MSLKDYRKKRNFSVSPEPSGEGGGAAEDATRKESKPRIYVVQKHRASQLHYDFRLQSGGTLLSWAVPKGPSLDPSVKRLAMQVEDHPIDYAGFEGVIPEGEYGGGTVMVWDTGTWIPDQEDVAGSVSKGELKFILLGKKLKGSWVLVRTHGYGSARSWLLIKHRDEFASAGDIAAQEPRSAVSNRLLAEIATEGGGDIVKAATGDPVEGKTPGKHATSPVSERTGRAKTGLARAKPAEKAKVKSGAAGKLKGRTKASFAGDKQSSAGGRKNRS